MCLSLLVFTQLFFESRTVRSQTNWRETEFNAKTAIQCHSRSCILGYLKSRRRTMYRYIIMLVSCLKFSTKWPAKTLEIAVVDNPTVVWRLSREPPRISAQNLYRQKVDSLAYILPPIVWAYIFIQIFVVGSERRIFSAIECESAVQGYPRSLILTSIERAYATSISYY